MLAIFGDTKYNKFSNTKFEGTCVYGICRTKPAAGGLPAMRRPGWLSCARGRGAVLRGMRASARAVFAAGTSEIEKKKAGNVLTNITCLCFHYTIDEYGVSSLRKGRKCERNPSGVSFAFNSRAQATVCAADRFRSNKKRHAEACLFLLVRMAIQNFLKNAVIATVFGFRTTKFLAYNFIFSPQIQGDC